MKSYDTMKSGTGERRKHFTKEIGIAFENCVTVSTGTR